MEKKYFNPLGAIVPEGFLIGKIIIEDFFFVILWLKKSEDRRWKTEEYWNADNADPFRETLIYKDFFFVLLTTSSPALLLKGEGCLLRSESC